MTSDPKEARRFIGHIVWNDRDFREVFNGNYTFINSDLASVYEMERPAREWAALADTVMVAEGMDILWTLSPDVFVLATSDKDLIPLARVAKQRGAKVVVIGSDLTAIPLREMADEHVTYKQLVTD